MDEQTNMDNTIHIPLAHHDFEENAKIPFSKLLSGASEVTLIVLVIMVGVCFIVNGNVPTSFVDFAKWVIGGTSITGFAYMIKSGVENKAKIDNAYQEDPEEQIVFINPEENDI